MVTGDTWELVWHAKYIALVVGLAFYCRASRSSPVAAGGQATTKKNLEPWPYHKWVQSQSFTHRKLDTPVLSPGPWGWPVTAFKLFLFRQPSVWFDRAWQQVPSTPFSCIKLFGASSCCSVAKLHHQRPWPRVACRKIYFSDGFSQSVPCLIHLPCFVFLLRNWDFVRIQKHQLNSKCCWKFRGTSSNCITSCSPNYGAKKSKCLKLLTFLTNYFSWDLFICVLKCWKMHHFHLGHSKYLGGGNPYT